MNLELNYEGFEKYMVCKKPKLGGVQYQFRFENGYGASVVKHVISYGSDQDLWELMVLKWTKRSNGKWEYYFDDNEDAIISDDAIGYCTDERIRELLQKIKDFKN